MGEVIGYGRVSSNTQSLDIQTDALTRAGCKRIYSEKFTGTRVSGRTELAKMLDYVREGDVLVITRLDRLARSLTDLLSITKQLEEKGVQFRCLDQAIDTTTPEGRMTYQILGVIAEFENSLRRARQIEGIAAAKSRPNSPYRGRPPVIKRSDVEAAVIAHGSKAAAAKALGISRDSVYRVLAGAEAA